MLNTVLYMVADFHVPTMSLRAMTVMFFSKKKTNNQKTNKQTDYQQEQSTHFN